MRSKDIKLGERYVARHRGATIVVTVDRIDAPLSVGGCSTVVATNQSTNEQIVFQSPLSIFRQAGPYIAEVKTLDDLFQDQIAVPEPNMQYQLRSIDSNKPFATVDYVIRRTDALYAKTACGKEYAITGEGACILVPTRS